MPLFVWAICAVFVILMVDFMLRRMRLNAYVKSLPKIPFAVLAPLLRPNKSHIELFQCLEKIINYYDGLSSCWLGTQLTVFCDDPENMKTILMSKDCVNKPYYYRLMTAGGDGLFTANGHDWHTNRKSINTVFTLSVLKKFQPIFNRHFANLTRALEKYVGQPEFDFTDFIFTWNFDIISETICRYDARRAEDVRAKAVEYISRLWQIATARGSEFYLHSPFIYRFTEMYAEEKKICNFLFQYGPRLVQHTIEMHATEISNESPDAKDSKSLILIDKLMEMEEQKMIDRKRLLEQINTFIVAGIDTTSVTILNTLLLLAMNQNVQDRLYEEIRTTVTNDAYVDYDMLPKLEYMDRVLKESMRLLPLSYCWARETSADVQLTECMIPKGTMVVLCLLKMHRDEKIWGPTALDFDPDRFLPEAAAQRHPFAFLPFSGGPRNCIGNKYAMMSMKVMLCHLLLKYKLTTSMRMSDVVFKFEFLLKLDNEYMFKLEERRADS